VATAATRSEEQMKIKREPEEKRKMIGAGSQLERRKVRHEQRRPQQRRRGERKHRGREKRRRRAKTCGKKKKRRKRRPRSGRSTVARKRI